MDGEFGVVVPTYRGASVLHRSLVSLARQEWAPPGPAPERVHVVVAVNDGSAATEQTAAALAGVVRAAGVRCTVVTSAPGRAAAIDRAERELAPGPRLYLDQDAALTPGALGELAAVLAPGTGVEFASLRPRVRTTTWVAAAYYRAWTALPYVVRSPATAGCYAVSRAGRGRWDAFPRLHSDDKFARLRFAPHERLLITDAGYEVVVAGGLRELVAARRRYLRGNRELRALPGPAPGRDVRRHGGYLGLLRSIALWPALAVFAAVYVAASTAEAWSRRGAAP